MSWIQSLLDKISPTDEKPIAMTVKMEREPHFPQVMKREADNVSEYLDDLLYFFKNDKVEHFRNSESMVLNSPYAAGLVINKSDDVSEELFTCIFETLRNNTERLDYRVNLRTCEIKVGKKLDEKREIYYLKPRVNYTEHSKYRQLFGNVKIERHIANDESLHISLLCTYYSGFNYTEALPFEEFVNAVCS